MSHPRHFNRFAMFGEPIPAQRLHAAGLINRLADTPDELALIEDAFVGRLASLNPRAVQQTRDIFRAAENMAHDNALDMGRQLNLLIGAGGGFASAGRSLSKKG